MEILWAYRTTKQSPTEERPFKLAYGCKAVIPMEVSLPTGRSVLVLSDDNDKQLRVNYVLIKE